MIIGDFMYIIKMGTLFLCLCSLINRKHVRMHPYYSKSSLSTHVGILHEYSHINTAMYFSLWRSFKNSRIAPCSSIYCCYLLQHYMTACSLARTWCTINFVIQNSLHVFVHVARIVHFRIILGYSYWIFKCSLQCQRLHQISALWLH